MVDLAKLKAANLARWNAASVTPVMSSSVVSGRSSFVILDEFLVDPVPPVTAPPNPPVDELAGN